MYDTSIDILALITARPSDGARLISSHYCRKQPVYHKRFWEAQQAGHTIDLMIEIPESVDVTADDYAKIEGHIYKIEQAQHGEDAHGLPCVWLSLSRVEGRLDIMEADNDSTGNGQHSQS